MISIGQSGSVGNGFNVYVTVYEPGSASVALKIEPVNVAGSDPAGTEVNVQPPSPALIFKEFKSKLPAFVHKGSA